MTHLLQTVPLSSVAGSVHLKVEDYLICSIFWTMATMLKDIRAKTRPKIAQVMVFLALTMVSSLPAAITIWKPPTIINITDQIPTMPRRDFIISKKVWVSSCDGMGLIRHCLGSVQGAGGVGVASA